MAFADMKSMNGNYFFEDFTEDNYRKILKLAKNNYSFISYPDYKKKGRLVLWRHDVDCSIHRAYKLAQIETEEDVYSTFFIWIHSPYYNILEQEVFLLIKKIIDLGHHIGLHFDYSFYTKQTNKLSIIESLRFEKHFLEDLFNISINAFSFHDPTNEILMQFPDDTYCDMVNAYCNYIQKNFDYCSDSNGFWRFKRLEDILLNAKAKRLQILLHPEWWTPEAMSPRERISRCINGRAEKLQKIYDKTLEQCGRLNIK